MIRLVIVIGYLLVPAAGIALTVVAWTRPALLARLGELLAVVMASRAARLTLVLFCWWLGWHFLADVP